MSDEVRHNVFDDPPESSREYTDLNVIISFASFSFMKETYRQQELEDLQPQLEALGYTEVKWMDGERDSFGPLTRVCRANDPNGHLKWFVYG